MTDNQTKSELEQEQDLLTIREAMAYTGLSEKTIRRYIKDKRLPAVRYGPRSLRIRRADLRALVKG